MRTIHILAMFLVLILAGRSSFAAGTLDIYFIDAELGNAVLLLTPSGQTITTLSIQPHILGLAYSPDSKWIAAGGGPGVVGLWNADTGQRLSSLNPLGAQEQATCEVTSTCGIESVAISSGGHWLAEGSDEDLVRLWRLVEQTSGSPWAASPSGSLHTYCVTGEIKVQMNNVLLRHS